MNSAARVLLLALAAVPAACHPSSVTPTDVLYTVGSDGNYRSIAAALEAAPAGEIIEVHPGTYNERLMITKPGMKLRGRSAVLDGSAASLGGRGIGILVSGAPDVEISGFTVRNFERGIVVQNASGATLRGNDVYANNSKAGNSSPPLSPLVDLWDGVVLIGATSTQIIDNQLHDNGHDGIQLIAGSRNNTIRSNRIFNNGGQTTPGQFG